MRQHKSPPMPRQTSGASCIYDFPDMKGTAPDDIGLVEMSWSEIAGDDARSLRSWTTSIAGYRPAGGSDEGGSESPAQREKEAVRPPKISREYPRSHILEPLRDAARFRLAHG